MPASQRSLDTGSRKGRLIVGNIGDEIRMARLRHGLSQASVARAVRISRAQLGRIERAENSNVSVLVLARLAAVLGMELSVRAYPAGQPIRDAAHRALLERLRARVGPGIQWHYERPIGGPGDLRAWDADLGTAHRSLGVEGETRLGDCQEAQRRVRLKLRDDPRIDAALLLLADTRHNREIVRANRAALEADFPIDGPAALRALAAGLLPGGSAIVLL
jgi:transcriptional regulator with XRE-family HTH domain